MPIPQGRRGRRRPTCYQVDPEDYTISINHWSREDFSREANPDGFTEVYDREPYNAMRQTLVDMGRQDGAGCRYAYTMVSGGAYSAVKRLLVPGSTK